MRDDQNADTCPAGSPPQTLYFCVEDNELNGAVTVRHCLNERTMLDGGHIGYGIRPSKRRQGYGTQALVLALEKAHEMGITDILLTCDSENAGSEKIMRKHGARYENTIFGEAGGSIKRFWIRKVDDRTAESGGIVIP